ncbi:hypothetical protein [Azospirillum picis]|uniref:Uncharacterized protein n=1 Tax=Azospirillum picis TaxID=488438 RepID=A0ABU0MEF1_9PROT|nr:hypothetical protein [Azospirillum picis]MBP2297977.1 hypothetical protein [Azospirillum picis]MDQ0531815.1 hypothetical protein [Azospirillum picis]
MTALLTNRGCALVLSGRMDHPADARFLAAWGEGATARIAGELATENPYLPDTISGWGWAAGWTETDPLIAAMPTVDRGGL